MSRGPMWISLVVALGVMALAVVKTFEGLAVTGAFGWDAEQVHVEMPVAYQKVDTSLERRDRAGRVTRVGDPFSFRRGAVRMVAVAPTAQPPVVVAQAPLLTAIVWDDDPRALVRWNGREWTIREGGLFDEFQVVHISREQVTLRRGDATLVLHRRNPGD